MSVPLFVLYLTSHLTRCETAARAIALNAVSLALAVAAYILYLLTISFHYDRVKYFTITALCWLASSSILFCLIGVEVRQHWNASPHLSLEYTQNFFCGIVAAGLYFLIATLLASYTIGMRSLHLSPTDRRKVECTNIILQAMNFAIILLIGAAIYSTVEDLSFMDALFFSDVTVLTVGLGNIVPKTHLGRSLLFPYATAGIIGLSLLITSVASFTNDMRDLKLRLKIEEARNAIHDQGGSEATSKDSHFGKKKQLHPGPVGNRFPKENEVLELHRIKSDFYRRSRREKLILFLAAWFVLWLVSAAIFRRSEKTQHWAYFTALYFTYTSLTTIGYGDYYPTSNFGTVFFVFWSLIALPILTNLVAAMGQVIHGMLVYISVFMWKHVFHKARRQRCHWHEDATQSHDEDGKHAASNVTSHPAAGGNVIRNKKLDRDLSMTGYASNSVLLEKAESSSAGNGLQRLGRTKTATQYSLLVAEEIERLVLCLRDESVETGEELCCTWARIFPLLHTEKNDAGVPVDRTPPSVMPKSETLVMEKLTDPERAVSERNAEYLWMLTLLTSKLCYELREEWY